MRPPTWSYHEQFDLRLVSQLLESLRQLKQLQLLKRQDKPGLELVAKYCETKINGEEKSNSEKKGQRTPLWCVSFI